MPRTRAAHGRKLTKKNAPLLRQSAWTTALAVLLASCGGADDGHSVDSSASAAMALEDLLPGTANGEARFIITLNAAVVAENARARSRTLALASDSPRTLAERSVQSLAARLMGTASPTTPPRRHPRQAASAHTATARRTLGT